MKFYLVPIALFSVLLSLGCSTVSKNTGKAERKESKERWIGELSLKNAEALPFIFEKYGSKELIIHNADERISLLRTSTKGDSCVYSFPDFESHLTIKFEGQTAGGRWSSKNKSYQLKFKAKASKGSQFQQANENTKTIDLSEKWRTVFSPDSDGKGEDALGMFQQKGNEITGTFLTETGDYRFLSGNIFGNNLYLSCFDGSHAFLFKAVLENDTLKGEFFSGKSYHTTWYAIEDDQFELRDPFQLTYIEDSTKALSFTFNDLNLDQVTYPNESYKDKVTIVQIMGSWCPNCIDETRYYLDLYEKYHEQGLEIILVGYENGKTDADRAKRLINLKERYSIPYQMLIGGSISKAQTSKDFPMLNNVISYPTSLFVDKSGKVVKVHTGFYGPGTGNYYEQYVAETDAFVQKLLAN